MIEIYVIHDNSPFSKHVVEVVSELKDDRCTITFRDFDRSSLKLRKEANVVLYKHGTDKIPFTTLSYNGKVFRAVYMEELKNIKDYESILRKKINDVALIINSK